jgi:hypothetical protein
VQCFNYCRLFSKHLIYVAQTRHTLSVIYFLIFIIQTKIFPYALQQVDSAVTTVQNSINPGLTAAYTNCSTPTIGEPSEISVPLNLFACISFTGNNKNYFCMPSPCRNVPEGRGHTMRLQTLFCLNIIPPVTQIIFQL